MNGLGVNEMTAANHTRLSVHQTIGQKDTLKRVRKVRGETKRNHAYPKIWAVSLM